VETEAQGEPTRSPGDSVTPAGMGLSTLGAFPFVATAGLAVRRRRL
jgi:hypothetical protein